VSSAHSFKVKGMHCPACEFLVAEEVSQDAAVGSARASLAEGRLWVELKPGQPEAELSAWKARWNAKLDPLGYRLYLDHEDPARESRRETWLGLLAGGTFLLVFSVLQATEIINLFAPDNLGLQGSFLLGVLASLSSCFALVGGLLVSYTAAVGRRNPGLVGPGLVAFHLARVGVFFAGGGLLALAGSALGDSFEVQRVLLTLASVVMAALGLNLLGVRLPQKSGSRKVMGQARGFAAWGTVGGGALLGAATFFLPCGFTQSVQFQALAAGAFLDGAWLTLAFVLGTFPVLASVGWLLGKGLAGKSRAILLKAGGTVVLGLGLFQFWGALHLWGLNF